MTAGPIDFEWRGWGIAEAPVPEPDPPPVPGQYAVEVLADTPHIYWRNQIGQTVNDFSGNGLHADTPSGSAGSGLLHPDQSNQSRIFTSYINSWERDNDNGGPATSTYTIEWWVKSNHMPTTGYKGTQYGMYRFASSPNGLYPGFTFNTAGDITFSYGGRGSATAPWLRDGLSHHVVGVMDDTHIRLYIDGVEVASTLKTAGGLIVETETIVGLKGSSGIPSMIMEFDEVAFYRHALPPERIRAHYYTGRGEAVPPAPDPDPEPAEPTWVLDSDRSAALVSWSITYGRGDSNARTRPTQASVVLASDVAGDPPTIGERVRLQLSEDRATDLGLVDDEEIRFTGEVTDAEFDTVRGLHTVTAIGRLGRALRRRLDPHWPQELDGQRVARILAAASADVGTIDPGTVELTAQVTANSAGQLLDRAVDSTLGQVVEQPTGVVDWHDAEHRRDAPVLVTIDAGELLNDVKWSQHVGDVLNDLTVGYGIPVATVRAHDPNSIDDLDDFPGSLSTDLTTASDAHSLGTLIVARRRLPVWQLPALVVDLLRTVDDVKLAQLLALRHGDRVRVTGLPAGGPYAGDVDFFVEGHHETAARATKATKATWRLALAVSDPTLSGVSLRWIDAPVDLVWDDVDPALTWLDAGLIDDPADLGA